MTTINKQYFMTIQNMRTGSSWLELSLNALGDVYADYELKWEINYPSLPIHKVIQDR
ncbi:MAG: hypothetical protein HOK65_14305 [Crocinitomicaceae bacterium]|jgi:hypothetical protein|nr:hypothetical protein [Crocinitomicaceae bacterium]